MFGRSDLSRTNVADAERYECFSTIEPERLCASGSLYTACFWPIIYYQHVFYFLRPLFVTTITCTVEIGEIEVFMRKSTDLSSTFVNHFTMMFRVNVYTSTASTFGLPYHSKGHSFITTDCRYHQRLLSHTCDPYLAINFRTFRDNFANILQKYPAKIVQS